MRRAAAMLVRPQRASTVARPRRLRSPLPPPPLPHKRNEDDPGLYRVATVPNALSAVRIALAPAVGALVWHGAHDAAALAGCVLAATDWLDGYVAQKFDQMTILGKFLDPLGDKALVCCVGVPLALRGELPPALVGLVVARDVGLVFGTRQVFRAARQTEDYDPRFFLFGGMDPRAIGLDATPSLVSKLNTSLQFVLGGVVLGRGGDVISSYLPAVLVADATVDVLCCSVIFTTLLSGADYFFNKRGVMSARATRRPARRRDPGRSPPRRYRLTKRRPYFFCVAIIALARYRAVLGGAGVLRSSTATPPMRAL